MRARARRLCCAAGASLLTVLATAFGPSPSAAASDVPLAAPASHATWVWTRPDPGTLVRYATDQGVTDLYVMVPTTLRTADRKWLRSLHSRAGGAGIDLWALGGDPAWVNRPQDALDWQRQALAVGVFVGSHVDVEPYALPGWDSDSAALAGRHVNLMARLQADSALPLQADLPFWAGSVATGTGASWADEALAVVDGVTVMSYRDSAEGILATGEDLLARGDAAGVPVQLAAETVPLADCSYCTFAEEGRSALAAALLAVDASARAAHPSYVGTSVHDYQHWSALHA